MGGVFKSSGREDQDLVEGAINLSPSYNMCKDQFWGSAQEEGAQAQKAQNNEFVKSGLENWAKMSWTTNRVGSNDKNRKID